MATPSFSSFVEMGIAPFDLRQPVYKYRSIESAAKIIESNQIYFATATELNDKFELHPSILDVSFTNETKENYLKGFLRRNKYDDAKMSDEQFRGLIENSKNFFRTQLGIFSTSKSSMINTLWEHYGDNHKGICLGFKVPFNCFPTRLLFNINYTDSPKKVPLFDTTEEDISKEVFYWMCTKHADFSFEKEVRIINETSFGLTTFNKAMVYEVMFGRDTTDEDFSFIINLLMKNNYPVQRIGKIIVDDNSFGLQTDYLTRTRILAPILFNEVSYHPQKPPQFSFYSNRR